LKTTVRVEEIFATKRI